MTVRPEKVIDSPTLHTEKATASSRLLAPAQLLAQPEDEEEPVVGPRPQQDHDEQDRGEVGDLHAEVGGLGDDRPGGHQGHGRGNEGDERGQQGPEGEEEESQDEQDREELDQGLDVAVLALIVHRGGQPTGEVHGQAGRCAGGGEGGPQGVDRLRRPGRCRSGRGCPPRPWPFRLGRWSTPPGRARPSHGGPGAWPVRPSWMAARSAELRTPPCRRRPRRSSPGWSGRERCGQLGRPHARGGGRQEVGVAVLLDAAQRGERRDQDEGGHDPAGDDQPAEAHGEPSEGGKQAVILP